MSAHLLFESLVLGLSIAAPVGPIAILCIRRSIVDGWLPGMACGLGAATADALYGALGGFASNGLSLWLVRGRLWLTLAGGAFLLGLGFEIFSSPVPQATRSSTSSATGAYLSTVLLTLANPLTILSFAAAFAGMSGAAASYDGIATMLVGVFVGSALWWLALTSAARMARGRLSAPVLVAGNRLSGLLLMSIGLYRLWECSSLPRS